jgi:hypothetical protein
MIKNSYSLPILAVLCTVFPAAVNAQTQPQQEAALLAFARDTATVAGGARYCELDPDDIEEFISKADGKMTLMARDDYQKILARVEFKNILVSASAKEPEKGCESLERAFSDALRSTR